MKGLNLKQKILFNFDFDGTIVDSNKIKEDAFLEILDHDERLLLKLKKIKKCNFNVDRHYILKKLCQFEKSLKYEIVLKKYNDVCFNKILKSNKISGITDFLSKLKLKKKLSIINSATPLIYLKQIIKGLELTVYFNHVLGRPYSKEKNLIFIKKKYNLKKSEIIIIGDGEGDRICAERLGCEYIGFENNFSNYKIKPRFIIKDYNDIIDLI